MGYFDNLVERYTGTSKSFGESFGLPRKNKVRKYNRVIARECVLVASSESMRNETTRLEAKLISVVGTAHGESLAEVKGKVKEFGQKVWKGIQKIWEIIKELAEQFYRGVVKILRSMNGANKGLEQVAKDIQGVSDKGKGDMTGLSVNGNVFGTIVEKLEKVRRDSGEVLSSATYLISDLTTGKGMTESNIESISNKAQGTASEETLKPLKEALDKFKELKEEGTMTKGTWLDEARATIKYGKTIAAYEKDLSNYKNKINDASKKLKSFVTKKNEGKVEVTNDVDRQHTYDVTAIKESLEKTNKALATVQGLVFKASGVQLRYAAKLAKVGKKYIKDNELGKAVKSNRKSEKEAEKAAKKKEKEANKNK